jgi:hypothetical protein
MSGINEVEKHNTAVSILPKTKFSRGDDTGTHILANE